MVKNIKNQKLRKKSSKQLAKKQKPINNKDSKKIGISIIILYFSIILIIIGIISWKMEPINKKLVQHRYAWDPNTYLYGIEPMKRAIEREKPAFILLGNSTLRQGIIGKKFNEITKVPTQRIYFGGSGSAWWYVTIKNVISKAKHKPKKLAIFFWDNLLTNTQHGVKGKYQQVFDMTSLPNEPLTDRLTFLNGMSEEAFFMAKRWSLYQKKEELNTKFVSLVKEKVGKWFNINPNFVDTAIANVFQDSLMNKELYGKKLASELLNNQQLTFESQLKVSYLPEIVRITKEAGIELMFVRVKMKRNTNFNVETKQFQQYILDLKEYSAKNDIEYLSFSYDDRIKEEHFSDNYHLNGSGQQIFTVIFAEKIMKFVEELKIEETPQIKDIGI